MFFARRLFRFFGASLHRAEFVSLSTLCNRTYMHTKLMEGGRISSSKSARSPRLLTSICIHVREVSYDWLFFIPPCSSSLLSSRIRFEVYSVRFVLFLWAIYYGLHVASGKCCTSFYHLRFTFVSDGTTKKTPVMLDVACCLTLASCSYPKAAK